MTNTHHMDITVNKKLFSELLQTKMDAVLPDTAKETPATMVTRALKTKESVETLSKTSPETLAWGILLASRITPMILTLNSGDLADGVRNAGMLTVANSLVVGMRAYNEALKEASIGA